MPAGSWYFVRIDSSSGLATLGCWYCRTSVDFRTRWTVLFYPRILVHCVRMIFIHIHTANSYLIGILSSFPLPLSLLPHCHGRPKVFICCDELRCYPNSTNILAKHSSREATAAVIGLVGTTLSTTPGQR
ncbi:unnamed protein product [Ectocarpus sp. 13 AM-2016]